MVGEWITVPLNAIAKVKSGKRLPLGQTLTSQRTAHPYIRLVDIDGNRIRKDNMQYLEPSTQRAISRYIVRSGDVCLAIVGHTIGLVFQVEEQWDGANLTENAARLTDFRGADPAFVFSYLRSQLGQDLIKSRTVGSAQGKLPLYAIASFPIPLPPLAEQQAIVGVLGALDDKIELNRRMNATLEAMVRALFQSWFVDFDPVRANLDSTRVAGVDKTTAALFPVHIEDSPLGKVPVGWRVLKFADVLTPHIVRVGEEIVPEFSATVTGLFSRDERFKKQLSKTQSKNKRIVAGDLVFGFSREVINFGLMREPVGAVSPVYEVFKIDSSKIEPELLERLFRFNMPYYMDILKPGAREGKPIDRDYLLRKHLLVPDIAVQRAYLATIQPWTDKIKANESESRTLATLRDTLLPKLLSGELTPTIEN